MVATPAFSQAPTDAQRNAIRSECRADYQAHCASIPPGGEASLQCLQKNMSSLSSGCQGAVRAVEARGGAEGGDGAAAAPKAESAPAAAPAAAAASPQPRLRAAAPKAAASAPASKPSDAQVAAIRSACRSDYQKVCAGVPTGGAPALQCLEKNKAKVSAPCAAGRQRGQRRRCTCGKRRGGDRDARQRPPPLRPRVIVLRPMRPREELFVLRSACSGDVRTLCGGVAPGGGRIMQCLATQAASISPACKDVLAQFAAQ